MKKLVTKILLLTLLTGPLSACLDIALWAVDTGEKAANRALPLTYWRERANQGDPEAMYFYGKAFCCGKRPTYDNYQAMEWFCKAASFGQRDALFEIANLYHNAADYEGFLLPRNDELALVYYTQAAKFGRVEAKSHKATIENKSSPAALKRVATLNEQFPNIPCGDDVMREIKKEIDKKKALNPAEVGIFDKIISKGGELLSGPEGMGGDVSQ